MVCFLLEFLINRKIFLRLLTRTISSAEEIEAMFKLAVFVSGGGTNLQALLDGIADGSLPDIDIDVVIASKKGTRAELRAKKAGIDCVVIERGSYDSTETYDQALAEVLAA